MCTARPVNLADALFQHPETLTPEAAHKIDLLYGRLEPLVDATLAQTRQLPALAEGLHAALSSVHGDLQAFSQATHRVSVLCAAAEKQVVSADVLRALCTRINDAVGPFERVLEQLHVQTDRIPSRHLAVPGGPYSPSVPGPPSSGPVVKKPASVSASPPPAAVLKAAVQRLVDIAVPKATAATTAAVAGVSNPLLDEVSSKTFLGVVGRLARSWLRLRRLRRRRSRLEWSKGFLIGGAERIGRRSLCARFPTYVPRYLMMNDGACED